MYDSVQKKLQIWLLWLLPVVGVVVVWLFLAQQEQPKDSVVLDVDDDDVEESVFASNGSGRTDLNPENHEV